MKGIILINKEIIKHSLKLYKLESVESLFFLKFIKSNNKIKTNIK